MTSRKYPTLYARLLANTRLDPESGCWLWTGQRSHNGYPQISMRIDGRHKTLRAHRVMAELIVGRLLHASLETVEHICPVEFQSPLCICPHHLALLPAEDNSRSVRARWLGREDPTRPKTLEEMKTRGAVWLPFARYAHPSEEIPF